MSRSMKPSKLQSRQVTAADSRHDVHRLSALLRSLAQVRRRRRGPFGFRIQKSLRVGTGKSVDSSGLHACPIPVTFRW
jgi:hypothetical protein